VPSQLDPAEFYGRIAGEYGQTEPDIFGHLGRRLALTAEIRPGDRVLDLGAGRGASLFPAAELAGHDGAVIGLDVAAGMVQATSAEIARRGLPNAQMRLGRAEQLEFPDASFDAVIGGFAIIWFEDPLKALAESFRVLRPAGRIAFSRAYTSVPGAWYDRLLQEYDRRHHIFARTPDDVHGLDLSPAGLVRLIAGAGFVDIHDLREDHDFVFPNAAAWWAARWTHGSRAPLEAMAPAVLAQFKADAFAALPVADDGVHELWPLAIVRARKPT
jgi:O-methyltransferase/aklanonic acid methyltransferase